MILISMAWPPLIYADTDMWLGLIWSLPLLHWACHTQCGGSLINTTPRSPWFWCVLFFSPSVFRGIALICGKSPVCWSSSVSPVFYALASLGNFSSSFTQLAKAIGRQLDHTAPSPSSLEIPVALLNTSLWRCKYYCTVILEYEWTSHLVMRVVDSHSLLKKESII